MARHFGGDEVSQALHLAHPARMHQPKVRIDGMHGEAVPFHGDVQQPPLLETVVGNVLVLVV